MIPVSVVEEIKRLLAEGRLSQRKIARQTGISRGSVGLIAQGKRPDYQPRRQSEEDPWATSGTPQRCPDCGGLVYMPCRLCGLRALLAKARRRPGSWTDEVLGLQLNDEHRARYEQVRHWPGQPSVEDLAWEVVS